MELKVDNMIYEIRRKQVMLDSDVAHYLVTMLTYIG